MTDLEAARIVIEVITQMATEVRPLMLRVLPEGEVHHWQHYPNNDARDALTRSRWYYHVHAPGDRDPAEHGHFHLFLHRTQLTEPAVALTMPATGEDAPAHVTHLAGLSIGYDGVPLAWFVTNRWVTDEFLYPAEVLAPQLDRYDVDATPEDVLVNRLLTAMVALYRKEIAELLAQRDTLLENLVAQSGSAAYESGHAVLATCPIDLDAKIGSLGLL